ncbi:MAG: PEP-CTERM sorting domain-containing protein [Planctomycetales bacterium]|nr:PEP-CTERM sorting domain-containing protein [Planctomycetales bacterium]
MRIKLLLVALSAMLLCATQSQAAFVAAVDLDTSATQVLHPNFSFGGDTTSASSSALSYAVGLPPHQSIFGGNGLNFGDTYIMSYTPGTDADNFFPAAGSLLGSVTGFGTELASGAVGGGSGLYNVYVTVPSSANVNVAGSNFTITGDGAPVVLNAVNLNDGGTGADLDPGAAFVGGANNAWFLLGSVQMTAGVTYTMTQDANANSFVSQRLAGVMWEKQIPEPTSIALIGMGGVALLAGSRRRRS